MAQTPDVIKIGGLCDRTGESKVIGQEYCPAVADYIALVNRKGGVLGHKLEYTEIDHAYTPERAIDGYERLKRDGVVTIMNYGVPTLLALTPRYMADRIPAFNSGTGRGDAIDGVTWPYIFPGVASYWSQAGVVMKYLKDNGAKKGTKIAYLYFDNPAGRDGIAMVEAIANVEGYVVRKFPVQPPGIEIESQVNEIIHDFKPDWVVPSLFGKSPAVAIKEFRKGGFPLNRVVSFVWGAGSADVEGAGWDVAQGYLGVQFAAIGRAPPVMQELVAMFRDQGKDVPEVFWQRLLQPWPPAWGPARGRHPARDPEPRLAGHRRQRQARLRGDPELRRAGARSLAHVDAAGSRRRGLPARVPGEGHRVGARERLDTRLSRRGHGAGEEGQQQVARRAIAHTRIETVDSKKLDALRRKYSDAKGGDIFDPEFAAVAAQVFSGAERRKWPFADPATLLGAPFRPDASSLPDFGGLDVALVGVPMDLGVTNRAGARLGPRAVRGVERIGPFDHVLRIAPTVHLAVADIGDVPMQSRFSLDQCHADIEAFFTRICAAGVIPLAVGGDHSITCSILKAVGRERPVGMVHIDAHCDTSGEYEGAKFHHGGPFRQAVLAGVLDPERSIQIGIRGGAEYLWEFSYDSGMTVLHDEDVTKMGIPAVVARAREVVGDGPVYVTFDVDGVDPGFAPGTGTPEVGGLTPREVLAILRGLAGLDVVGGDVVEIAPQYDATTNTAQIGAQCLFEMLCLVAVARAGRHHGASTR